MAYMELVYQELNNKLNPLIEQKERIEYGIKSANEDIEVHGESVELVYILEKLKERNKGLEMQISNIKSEYIPDPNLRMLAHAIDSIDNHNMGIDLMNEASNKLKEVMEICPKIERCYSSEYDRQVLCQGIRNTTQRMKSHLNTEIPKIEKKDNSKLIQEFNERYRVLESEKNSEKK